MQELEELVLESLDYRDSLEDYIASVCFEINRLKVNYPNEDLAPLVSKLSLLLKQCDNILVDNENIKNKLDSSLRETAALACKLDIEKNQREQDLNMSFYALEAKHEDGLELMKQREILEEKLSTCEKKYNSLLEENIALREENKKISTESDSLVLQNNKNKLKISNMKRSLDAITSDLRNLEHKRLSWEKDKWVDDTIISAYFSALADNTNRNDILFLDPSATQMIKFSTPESTLDCLKLTNYHSCRYIFLCVNNCTDAGKESGGSHWSLLFIDKVENAAYHLDSIKSVNEQSALTVAENLGIHCSRVTEIACMQQKHSFECGIHVLANANYIANHYCRNYEQDISFVRWFSSQGRDVYNNQSCEEKRDTGSNTLNETCEWQHVPMNQKRLPRKEACPTLAGSTYTFVDRNRFDTLNQIHRESEPCLDITPTTVRSKSLKINKPRQMKHRQEMCHSHLKKPRLTVASDSQGRGLAAYLDHQNDNFAVFNTCQPGAPLQPIFDSIISSQDFKTYSKADCVTVIAGTNDILNCGISNKVTYIKNLTVYIQRQFTAFEHTNLIMSTIPYRYDLDEDSKENKLIKEINMIIRNLAYKIPHVKVLDIHLFQRRYHTKHGLHINRSGKKKTARIILELAKSASLLQTAKLPDPPRSAMQDTPGNINTSTVPDCLTTNTTVVSSPTSNQTPTVQVLEADMQNMINDFKEDISVAFAHGISGDFGDRRQMSAGVAAIFKKTFGRPKHTDCLSNFLTLQWTGKQAAVYGLVTKDVYCGKPSKSSYDKSFMDLTEDFKKKCYKRLICSPIGCMRDLISPLHFAKNIVRFHRITGAAVTVVVKDERATRTLRKGISHDKFVKLLRSSIAAELDLTVFRVVSESSNTAVALHNVNHFRLATPPASDSTILLSHGFADQTTAYGLPPATTPADCAASSPQLAAPLEVTSLFGASMGAGAGDVVVDSDISMLSEDCREENTRFLDVIKKAKTVK